MIVEAFKPEHFALIELQPVQADTRMVTPEYLSWLHASGPAGTLRTAEGAVIACAGMVDFEGGSYLWCYLSRHAGPHMVGVVRAAKRLVQVARSPMYATTPCGFDPGCRLLGLLGFKIERALPQIDECGRDHQLFVRTA